MKKILSIFLLSVTVFTACAKTPEETSTSLAQTFNTKGFGYTFNYPSDWHAQEDLNVYAVTVANEKASVRIQNLASTTIGGTYTSVDEVVTQFKAQLDKAENVKLTDEKEFIYTMEDGTKLVGKQFVAEFAFPKDNATYKELQIIIPRKDGKVFHAWSYMSLLENYDQWFGVAGEILATWKIMQ